MLRGASSKEVELLDDMTPSWGQIAQQLTTVVDSPSKSQGQQPQYGPVPEFTSWDQVLG